jgi:hypothetical protein
MRIPTGLLWASLLFVHVQTGFSQDVRLGPIDSTPLSLGTDTSEFYQDPPAQPAPSTDLQARDLQRQLNETNDKLVETQELVLRLLSGQGLGSSVPSMRFMPPPADPNDLDRNESTADINLGAGSRLGPGILFRAALSGNAEAWYDTGRVSSAGGAFIPCDIALPGTTASRRAGFFDLLNTNAKLALDLQAPIERLEEAAQAQAFLETEVVAEDLRIRHAFGRVANVLAGQYWTAWGDEGTLPKSIITNTAPAGSIFARTPQIRVALPLDCGWVASFAIQKPLNNDFTLVDSGPDKDVRLQRYPDFAARFRYFNGDYNSVSVGAFVRQIGREDINEDEDFVTGWGVSAAARFRTGACSTVQIGIVGGEGLAGTIFGLSTTLSAAGPTASFAAGGELTALTNYGAFAGYQHFWSDNCQSNLAYGFAWADGTDVMSGLAAHNTHNAWANLIYELNDNFSFGLEYHYGRLETLDGTSGDNHRIQFVLQLTASKPATKQSRADLLPQSIRDQVLDAIPEDTGVSQFPRL